MNRVLLFLVMLPSALWRALGADTGQLRALLNIRLTLDDRRPMSFGMRRNNERRERRNGTLINTLVFAGMGLFYALPVWLIQDRVFSLAIYFSLLIALMTFMLITDFSNVLFDSRDKYIVLPRPIDDRTLVLSRILHVFIYLIRIVVPISLAAWVAIGYKDGWLSALLFPLPLALMVCIVLFFVNSIYLLVLRFSRPERFKDIISYFQIVTSIIFFATVYLRPRISKIALGGLSITDYPAIRFLPSYWLASCWSWIGYPVYLSGTALYSAMAVIVPLICLYVLVRWLSPQFSRRIAGIDASDSAPAPAGKVKRTKGTLYRPLANIFNRTDEGKAGFMIGWLQSSRSRSFRMRVYPSFAFVPIYSIYIFSSHRSSTSQAMTHLSGGPFYLFLLYMCSFSMITALTYITSSDQYKAAWVYYATPVQVPGRVMAGALKALWAKFFLPFFGIISIFVLYIWGPAVISDILLAFVNVTLVIACIARINFRFLPFSMIERMRQGGGRVVKSFATAFVPLILGGVHYLSIHLLWLKIIFLVLSSILLWLVVDSYASTSWDNVVKGELE